MKRILSQIEVGAAELKGSPLFAFLADASRSPADRLAFVVGGAHFVMSFADLCAEVLRSEPAQDAYQRLVNVHLSEDENHWQWFLSDLGKLGLARPLTLAESLRLLWSPETLPTRMLTYEICRLGLHADSLRKLALLHVVEAAFQVTIAAIADVAAAFERERGVRLDYLGPSHKASEDAHTVGRPEVHAEIADIQLGEDRYVEFRELTRETLALFRRFLDGMYVYGASDRRLRPSLPPQP